jgi:hypothetical protein
LPIPGAKGALRSCPTVGRDGASAVRRDADMNRMEDLNVKVCTVNISERNIASDDALILPYRANPAGLNFRKRQVLRPDQLRGLD